MTKEGEERRGSDVSCNSQGIDSSGRIGEDGKKRVQRLMSKDKARQTG